MCGICGAFCRDGGGDVLPLVVRMLREMGHRGPDGAGVAWEGGLATAARPAALPRRIGAVHAGKALGHVRLRITGGERGRQPFTDGTAGMRMVYNGEIYNFRELLRRWPSFCTDTDGEVLFRMLFEGRPGSGLSAVRQAIPSLDGVYAFAVMDRDSIVLARDRVGVKQVYVGEDGRFVAFASERKALWSVGLRSRRLGPGEIIRVSGAGIERYGARRNPAPKILYGDRARATEVYRAALVRAVRKRVDGHRRVGVLFSGGVDSALIARVAAEHCPEVIAYAGGRPGAPDLRSAIEAAYAIGMPLRIAHLDNRTIEALLPEVIAAIEDRDLMQVEVALPMYAALRLARRDGVRVVLTGQGADELFGGYEWYEEILARRGEAAVVDSMWDDLGNLYRDTLEREDKMSMAHSIELRVPFLDPALIREAMSIAPHLKIDRGERPPWGPGKSIHRELALAFGVPRTIAYRPKDGAQHGSGIHAAMAAIARRKVTSVSCPPLRLDEPEQRGSAYRHRGKDVAGSTYGSREAQAYVDTIARRVLRRFLEDPLQQAI